MMKSLLKTYGILFVAILLGFSGQAYGAKTYLTVRNCTDMTIDVRLYNGNDTARIIAASSYSKLGVDKSVKLHCNHTSCDVSLRKRKNLAGWNHYDSNTKLNVRVTSTAFKYSLVEDDYGCDEDPPNYRRWVEGKFTDGVERWAYRDKSETFWVITGTNQYMTDDKNVFNGDDPSFVFRVGDFDNDGLDEVAWMMTGFEKWVVNGAGKVAVEQDLPNRKLGNTLNSGGHMARGDFLISSNGLYRFRFRKDQNLVLYRKGGIKLWAAKTGKSGASKLLLETTGNLKLIGTKWQSRSKGSGPKLVLEDSGRLAIYSNGKIIWSVN